MFNVSFNFQIGIPPMRNREREGSDLVEVVEGREQGGLRFEKDRRQAAEGGDR